jgi:hypothetical protein
VPGVCVVSDGNGEVEAAPGGGRQATEAEVTERPKAKPDCPSDTSGASMDFWWDELGWWTTEKRKPRRKAEQ